MKKIEVSSPFNNLDSPRQQDILQAIHRGRLAAEHTAFSAFWIVFLALYSDAPARALFVIASKLTYLLSQ